MQQKTLLICDDDPSILEVLELAFKPHFHTIVEADSLKVMELIRANRPDVILLDLWMPFLSGDQLIRLLRRDEILKDLRIVAISASPTGKKVALAAGADSFIAKPFEMDHLLCEINSLASETLA
jgi:CheY-like chemotaxis protein